MRRHPVNYESTRNKLLTESDEVYMYMYTPE